MRTFNVTLYYTLADSAVRKDVLTVEATDRETACDHASDAIRARPEVKSVMVDDSKEVGYMDFYLVRVDNPKLIVGRIVGADSIGFRFYPNGIGHTKSRKLWPTPVDCVPRWATHRPVKIITKDEYDNRPSSLQGVLDDISQNAVPGSPNGDRLLITKAMFLQLMTIRDDLAAKRRVHKPHILV